MGFDIGTAARAERAKPRWVLCETEDRSLQVRALVAPRDAAIVTALDAKYPETERLTPAGRVKERTPEHREAFLVEYLVAHLRDWDITLDGAKAPITAETVGYLPDSLQLLLAQHIRSENLGAHEVPSPFLNSRPTSDVASITPA